ncbi:MAG: hypothetical protein M3R49_01600 [Chloroflexota bacterium]|nr:hypothetical protein [Chloroflexota bacterium]
MDAERRAGGHATADTDVASDPLNFEPATIQDRASLAEMTQRRPGGAIRMRLDDGQDVSGHGADEDPTVIRVLIQDDELDTEGHTISLRLPSVEEADAFRRRLVLTGVLVGSVVLGGAGIALAVSQHANTTPAQASSQISDVSYEDATPNSGTV